MLAILQFTFSSPWIFLGMVFFVLPVISTIVVSISIAFNGKALYAFLDSLVDDGGRVFGFCIVMIAVCLAFNAIMHTIRG